MVLAITLTINLIALALEILFLILEGGISGYLAARKKKQEAAQNVEEIQELPERPKRVKSLWHKIAIRGTIVCSAILLLIVLTAVIANAFFFESVMRFALRQVDKRTDIAIEFDKAGGSFWTGQVCLDGVSVKRQGHPTSCFDLKGESVELDLSVSELFRWSVVFESVKVSGFDGTWEQVGKADKLKPKRKFRIDRLLMDDVQLEFTDRTREKGPFLATIKLDTLESSPLRSHWAVFDVLFRSRGIGSVNQVPFVINSESGKHSFRMNDVPVELLANYVGTLDWFETGKVDLLIEDKIGDGEIAMHWSLTFHDFKVKAPEGTNLKVRTAAMPLVAFLNLKSKRLPLEFDLQMKENEFRFKSTTELNDVARIVLGDKIMDGLKKIMDRFKKDDDEG